ncbi:hypothetical protein HYQ46_011062 [Verticillium longisporum]|nr:hypothetical protein HYQ46_011062 [Verticillium longisporum]
MVPFKSNKNASEHDDVVHPPTLGLNDILSPDADAPRAPELLPRRLAAADHDQAERAVAQHAARCALLVLEVRLDNVAVLVRVADDDDEAERVRRGRDGGNVGELGAEGAAAAAQGDDVVVARDGVREAGGAALAGEVDGVPGEVELGGGRVLVRGRGRGQGRVSDVGERDGADADGQGGFVGFHVQRAPAGARGAVVGRGRVGRVEDRGDCADEALEHGAVGGVERVRCLGVVFQPRGCLLAQVYLVAVLVERHFDRFEWGLCCGVLRGRFSVDNHEVDVRRVANTIEEGVFDIGEHVAIDVYDLILAESYMIDVRDAPGVVVVRRKGLLLDKRS